MTELVLSIDHGSGGSKAGLVTFTGEIVWSWNERLDIVNSSAAQDAEGWWQSLTPAIREGIRAGGWGARVAAVAVTGQWSSTIAVDVDGLPVTECLMWTDTRGADYSRERFAGPVAGFSPRAAVTWLRRSGGIPNPAGSDPIAHMLHLDRDRPEIQNRARWYLEPVDYLTMRFTGVPAATVMSMFPSWLIDNRTAHPTGYDPVLVDRAGINPDRLPPLVPNGSVIGTVRPDVAASLGISASARVVTGLPDIHNAVVASGCTELHQTHIGLGTSDWVTCPMPRKTTSLRWQMASVPGLGLSDAEGDYILVNSQDNAGRAMEWFRHAVAPDLDHEQIEVLAASAPVGSGGVIFTPWLTGEHCPVDDRLARGGFHNVSLTSGRGELARAVMEGVALNVRWLLTGAEQVTRHRLDPIRVIGGAARSGLWCRIVADVTGRTLERVADPALAGVRGGGLYAGLVLGHVARAQLRDLVPVDRVFTPDPHHRAVYDRLFAEFPRLHARTKGMFRRLNG